MLCVATCDAVHVPPDPQPGGGGVGAGGGLGLGLGDGVGVGLGVGEGLGDGVGLGVFGAVGLVLPEGLVALLLSPSAATVLVPASLMTLPSLSTTFVEPSSSLTTIASVISLPFASTAMTCVPSVASGIPVILLSIEAGTNKPAINITAIALSPMISASVTIFFSVMTLKILQCEFFYFLRPGLEAEL